MTAVIGLDLSLQATGIATPDGVLTIRSSGRAGASLRVRRARLHDLATRVCLLVAEYAGSGALVVIEGPSFGSTTGSQHERAGLFWLVIDELLSAGHLVAEVPPTTLKKYATGKGQAKKGAMGDAAARRIPDVDTGGDDNMVDALWLRAMGCDHLGWPITPMPQAHRTALEAVRWPDAAVTA